MKSAVVKRSVVIGGHKTSVSLEDEFWTQLREIAGAKQATVSQLLAQIDERREHRNLSSAIRVYVLEHFRNLANSASTDATFTRRILKPRLVNMIEHEDGDDEIDYEK
jgi:predicted DNA-binding ribbon-helix-helix protein